MNYEQAEPVPYEGSQGLFAGWWVVLQGEAAFPDQSPMRWSLFACQTGHPMGMFNFVKTLNSRSLIFPIDFAGFAESRLREMIMNLEAQGVYNGDTLGPLSFQRF